MLKGRDIIFFSDDWGRYPSTTQHIAKILANQNRILWIGSLGLRKPKLNFKDIHRIFEKLKNLFNYQKPSLNNTNLFFTNPLIIPFHDNYFIERINSFLLLRKIKKIQRTLDFKNPILFTSTPIIEKLIGKLNESISLYFCLDDYSLFKGAFNSLPLFEKKMLEKVDVVFSVSDSLLNNRVPKSGKNYFLPQGVDFNHFDNTNERSERLAEINKKVIGFFGLISTWVNVGLIAKCALRYPDYSFVVIGKAEQNIEYLLKLANVEYKGEIPYQDLPNYAQKFDVGIIPFEINDLTIAVNPIKLIEYLALGIPVVSTRLPEVEKFKDLVFIAQNDDDFIKLIPIALKDNYPERNLLRKSKAKEFSWEFITEEVSKKINYVIK